MDRAGSVMAPCKEKTMRYLLTRLGSFTGLLAISGAAYADAAIPLPEPGVLELAGIGALAAIVARLARRRK